MREYEASAKTVEEAIELGLQEMGAAIGDVEVQVVEEGSKGLFGLFGSRMAKVKLIRKVEEEEDLLEGLMGEEKAEAPKAQKPMPEKAEKPTQGKNPQETEKETDTAEKPAREEPARPAPVRRTAKKAEPKPPKKEPPKKEQPEQETEETEKPEIRPMEKPELTLIPTEQLDPESPAGIAYAFLKELTGLMGVDVAIEMSTDAEGNVYGAMTGDTLGVLIGRRGETLDAIQYLTSLRVNRGQEGYVRVTLDTENYRARREDTLIRLANRMANRAVRTGRRVSLEPMNPYERRIIHYALQQNEAVSTHSEGEDPNRHVVITVRK